METGVAPKRKRKIKQQHQFTENRTSAQAWETTLIAKHHSPPKH